jgi:hypothetical protein
VLLIIPVVLGRAAVSGVRRLVAGAERTAARAAARRAIASELSRVGVRVHVRLDTSDFQRKLHAHLDRDLPRIVAEALNRTAFDAREDLATVAGMSFDFAGPSTERFLANKSAFVFTAAKPNNLEVEIRPRPRSDEILAPHALGETLTPESPRRFVIAGQIATPINAQVTARGRVRRSRTKGGTFLSRRGRAVLERYGRGAREVRVRFALTPTVPLRRRFDFYGTVKQTAERVFHEKARRAFEKLRSR